MTFIDLPTVTQVAIVVCATWTITFLGSRFL